MSDVHYALHDWDSPAMSTFGTQCPGHEGAGEIVAVGAEVKGLRVGQRAGFKPILDVCHTCEQCRTGHDNYCVAAKYTGLQVDGMNSHFYYLFPRGLCWIRTVADFAISPWDPPSRRFVQAIRRVSRALHDAHPRRRA